MHFDWNPKKAESNLRKHKVSFEEAVTSFYDENALLIPDPEHSSKEERFILLGVSRKLRVLLVSHCDREAEDTIRLISARKATKNELAQYEEQL